MQCPNCGKEIADDSVFCEFCGTKIDSKSVSKKKLKNYTPLWISVALIICALLLIVVYNKYDEVQMEPTENQSGIQATERQIDKTGRQTVLSRHDNIERSKQNVQQDYIDLGLPSGTKWKSSNELGWYNYYEASAQFGENLPTMEQLEELKEFCTWSWSWSELGYVVRGPNGKEIFLPADGDKSGEQIVNKGEFGRYWSSSFIEQNDGTPAAVCLSFYSEKVYMYNPACTLQILVRLTK